ncbi:unnamed protein product, partial [Aphanomyces euteiches]
MGPDSRRKSRRRCYGEGYQAGRAANSGPETITAPEEQGAEKRCISLRELVAAVCCWLPDVRRSRRDSYAYSCSERRSAARWQRRRRQSGDGRAKPDAGAKGDGKGGAAAKPAAEKSKEDAKPKKKLGCLKCGDASHRVADCPKAAPGEAQKLLDAQLKKWREAVQVLGDMPERRRTDRGAMVEALVRVDNVLLDTGADVNVVSRGVMDALAAKGA